MKKFWKATGISGAYFVSFLLIQLWISLAASFFVMASLAGTVNPIMNFGGFMEAYAEKTTQNLTGMILASNLVTVLGFWAFFRLREKSFLREIGLVPTDWQNLALAVLFGIGMCFTIDLVTIFLPIPEKMMEQFAEAHGNLWEGNVLLTFLSVSLAGPVSEEICFRGLCYTRLKQGMRPIWAGLIASIFFGLAHGDPVWFLVGFLAGAATAWIFEITGSLWTSILVHVVNNSISNLTAYLPISPVLHLCLIGLGVVLLIVSGILLYRRNRWVRQEPVLYFPE